MQRLDRMSVLFIIRLNSESFASFEAPPCDFSHFK